MSQVCYFELRSQVTRSNILAADFSVYIHPPSNQAHRSQHITYLLVYRLRPPNSPGQPPVKMLFKSKKINLNIATAGWKSFKIRSVIQDWINDPRSNYGLLVECFDHNGNSLVVTPGPGNTEEEDLYVSIL